MAGGSFQHPPPQGSLSPSLNLAAFEPREPPLRNIRQPQNTGGTSGILRPTDPTTPSRRVSDRRSSSPIEASPDGQSTRERETFSPSSSRHHSAQHWNLSARQPGARARGGNDYTGLATRDPLAPLVWSSTRPVNPNLTPNAPALSTNATTGVMMTSFQAAGLTIRFNGRTLSQFSELPEARQNVATNLEERPPPLSNEQMTVRVDCKICFTQRATVVVLPCGKSFPGSIVRRPSPLILWQGHCVMCKWCQQQCAPTDGANSTRPADPSTRCPICRQGVREIVSLLYN
ncbi:MAG: hypothetical protein LQ342_000201 [Letrouitia transgressa]|nr:MAG: hypothetical protein LQ342_000201 [Letrouitia transgressa]